MIPFTRASTKRVTLVLDVDETLISVRRWVDEAFISQSVKYFPMPVIPETVTLANASSTASIASDNTNNDRHESETETETETANIGLSAEIVDITKQATIVYDSGYCENLFFHLTEEHPFDTLSTTLDTNDRINIDGKSAVVHSITTLEITIRLQTDNEYDYEYESMEDNSQLITFDTGNHDSYLNHMQYQFPRPTTTTTTTPTTTNNVTSAPTKFVSADLLFNNLYLVRFRPYLSQFLDTFCDSFEIILWTAALRETYQPMMQIIHNILIEQINEQRIKRQQKNGSQSPPLKKCAFLWEYILFRDNCTQRDNGTYFKDLSLLGRDLQSLIMIDNLWQNFQGFETNGLPIIDFWGHSYDNQLRILSSVLTEIFVLLYHHSSNSISISNNSHINDVRLHLHSIAIYLGFNNIGIQQMMQIVSENSMSKQIILNNDNNNKNNNDNNHNSNTSHCSAFAESTFDENVSRFVNDLPDNEFDTYFTDDDSMGKLDLIESDFDFDLELDMEVSAVLDAGCHPTEKQEQERKLSSVSVSLSLSDHSECHGEDDGLSNDEFGCPSPAAVKTFLYEPQNSLFNGLNVSQAYDTSYDDLDDSIPNPNGEPLTKDSVENQVQIFTPNIPTIPSPSLSPAPAPL
jgi:hypothetical protein